MVCTAVTLDGIVETATMVTGDMAMVEVTVTMGVRSVTTVAFGGGTKGDTEEKTVNLAGVCVYACLFACSIQARYTNLKWSQKGRGLWSSLGWR